MQQTVSSVVTKYLLDIQPGLAVVLSQDVGGSITRFVHAPRGIHARKDASNNWHWTAQDSLESVRLEADNTGSVEGSQNLDPFGNLIGSVNGTIATPYHFTGELLDGSGLLDLRARRYNSTLGIFPSLDPFEGITHRPMSLNGYSWVEGNTPNDAVGELKSSPPNPLSIAWQRGRKAGAVALKNRFANNAPNMVDPSGLSCISDSVLKSLPSRPKITQLNSVETLVDSIKQDYPVRSIERGLDTNLQQLPGSLTEQSHLSVLENLEGALSTIDQKLATLGKSLVDIFAESEYLDIRLDYPGIAGDGRAGITPYQIPNLQRLGNLMSSEHIAHEWGHAIDRKANFIHSNNLASQGIRTAVEIPATATISITNIIEANRPITNLSSCVPFPVGDPVQTPYGTSFQNYLLSGYPPGSEQYQRCFVGYGDIANTDVTDGREDWADMFMNWVYDRRESGGNAGFSKARQLIFGLQRRTWIDLYARGNF